VAAAVRRHGTDTAASRWCIVRRRLSREAQKLEEMMAGSTTKQKVLEAIERLPARGDR
jgi:hypothetical protein